MTTETATAAKVNEYGIPVDPKEALQAVKDGAIKFTEDIDKIGSGPVLEGLSIIVRDENGEYFNSDGKFLPFGWTKFDSLAGVMEDLGATLDDSQVAFIPQAFSGEENGKAVARLIDIYNGYIRGNARQNEYQRVTNLYKPMDEESKAKATERMITTFMQVFGVSREEARKKILG